MTNEWDCLIVGGGAAGLSAALVLGRARRRVLLVDAGAQSNRAAHAVGGFLGFDGKSPAELYERALDQVAVYPSVEVRRGEVRSAEQGFAVELADGSREAARTLVLAGGMDYRTPDIPGLAELWGKTVFHCPFCHGWELRDAPMAVLARGDRALHTALLLRGWTEDVVLLTDGPADFDDAGHELLSTAGVRIDDRRVAEFRSRDGELTAVGFDDGTALPRRGVLVATTLRQRSTLSTQLGVDTVGTPLSVDAIVVDQFQRTSVPGVFAAGDVTAAMPQVAAAVSSGSLAGAAVVQHLLAGDVGLPTPPWPTHREDQHVDV